MSAVAGEGGAPTNRFALLHHNQLMSRNRYFYYDHESCSFVEARPDRRRLAIQVGLTALLTLVLAATGVWAVTTTSTSPKELALQQENRALQESMAASTVRFADLEARLEVLSSRDRELYRSIFQADPVHEDVLLVGIGGSDDHRFEHFSPSTELVLRENASALDRLERLASLQSESFDELHTLARQRAAALPEMPAILPVRGTLTSGFGMRRHPILRIYRAHNGVDFSVPTGTPVYATGDGIIEHAGMVSGFGMMVRIRHPRAERVTLYAHLSRPADGIRPGVRVERGQVIAYSGNTGLSTAPHLHYEVHDLNGEPMNPIYTFIPGVRPGEYQRLLEISESDNAPLH